MREAFVSCVRFGRDMMVPIALFAAAISDPLNWLSALGLITDGPEWIYPRIWRQSICFGLCLLWLLVWYHRHRVAFEDRKATATVEALAVEKLKHLLAERQAQEEYAKQTAEIPKSPEDKAMGDHYENKGTVQGNMGPTTNFFESPKFQMTDAVMADVAHQLGGPRALSIAWVGSQKSFHDSQKLAAYLNGRGFSITLEGGIGMLIPPLENPIELRGNKLLVDSRK